MGTKTSSIIRKNNHDVKEKAASSSAANNNNDESPRPSKKQDSSSSEHKEEQVAAVDELLAEQIQRLGLVDESKQQQEEIIEEVVEAPESLKKIAYWISNSSKVMVLSGAGVSCSAGIPDFRTPGTGLYDNLQKYNLPYPEAVFDLSFYRHNPLPFCSLAKEIWPGVRHSPTLTHSFVALLAKKNRLVRNYSQNIDGLEFLANLPNERLVECHGHFRKASCTNCGKPHEGEECKRAIVHEETTPICKTCGGNVKPDIVFFGEGLPNRYFKLLPRDLEQVDLLLVMGTSLQVAPVSMIPELVPSNCRRVLLNRELVGDFDLNNDERDIFERGDCDASVRLLCRLLGWEEELLALNESTRIKVNPKDEKEQDENEEETAE